MLRSSTYTNQHPTGTRQQLNPRPGQPIGLATDHQFSFDQIADLIDYFVKP